MEKASIFDWLLNRHVHEYFDVDGRPIGEGRAQAYAQVETKFKSCPYSGSRLHHPHPMNVSALNSILPEWQHSLVLLAWLSQRYRDFHQTRIDTYYDLALLSGTGVFLTDYMALRRENPLQSHEFPVLMSGLYKVSLGFQQATFLAMMNARFQQEQEPLPDSKGFYAWLEQEKLLIGPEEVCGGSEAMISRAYEAMRGQTASPTNLDESLPMLTSMAIDWDAYDVFTFNVSELWRKAIWFVIQMRDFGIQIEEPSLSPALVENINTHLQQRFENLLEEQSGLTVEIARLTLEESGRSLEEWFAVQTAFLDEIGYQASEATGADGGLTADIMADLIQAVDLGGNAPTVAKAVGEQVARYAAFEAAVIRAFNLHLGKIQQALGYASDDAGLLPADLSAMFGRTVRG